MSLFYLGLLLPPGLLLLRKKSWYQRHRQRCPPVREALYVAAAPVSPAAPQKITLHLKIEGNLY
jgi:hypothetical protein